MNELAKHNLAREFMASFDFSSDDMSLDEWLVKYVARLDHSERIIGYAILTSFE